MKRGVVRTYPSRLREGAHLKSPSRLREGAHLKFPSRLREGLGEGLSARIGAPGQALPRPLPQAGGEQVALSYTASLCQRLPMLIRSPMLRQPVQRLNFLNIREAA